MPDHQVADDPSVERAVRERVARLAERFGWQLLASQALAEHTLAALTREQPADLDRFIIALYTELLYHGCLQSGDDLREQAYADLRRYLYRAAFNRWGDRADDIAQGALLLICEQIGRCNSPRAFLSFAMFKLLHAAQQQQGLQPAAELSGAPELLEGAPAPTDAEGALLAREQIEALLAALGRLPDPQKRAVIVLRFFGGLSDQEIGRRLQITPNHVRVLRHHGIQRLRQDPQLRRYFSQAGDRPPD